MSKCTLVALSVGLAATLAAGCSDESALGAGSLDQKEAEGLRCVEGTERTCDWALHPAIAVRDAPDVIYAVSDIHAGYDRVVALFLANGILADVPTGPDEARWGAGNATLVVIGDMIDKWSESVEVLDLVRALEDDAPSHGGEVLTLLGNHEAEFLADPKNKKADASDGIDAELDELGVKPRQFASTDDPHGAWLQALPFGALVGSWFFCHSGDSQGLDVPALEALLEQALEHHGWGAKDIVGDSSILESRDWFGADSATAAGYVEALAAEHIAFGHDPGALGPKGEIAVGPDAVLFRIDTGMSPGVKESKGYLLRVSRGAGGDTVEALDHDGRSAVLY